MKIVLSKEEIVAFKNLGEKAESIATQAAEVLGYPGPVKAESLFEIMSEIKFAKISIDLKGFVIEVDPKFVVDFLKVYGEIMMVVTDNVCVTIMSLKALDDRICGTMDKWFE